jgi:hypothetical protein
MAEVWCFHDLLGWDFDLFEVEAVEALAAGLDEVQALACDEGGDATSREAAVGAGCADEIWLELVHVIEDSRISERSVPRRQSSP